MKLLVELFNHLKPKLGYLVTLVLLLFLGACASHYERTNEQSSPADRLIEYFRLNNVSSTSDIKAVLPQIVESQKLPSETETAINTYPALSAKLLHSLLTAKRMEKALDRLVENESVNMDKLIFIALNLNPDKSEELIDTLFLNHNFSEESIQSAALMANVESDWLFPATASDNQAYRIQPLIHSVSITLFNQARTLQSKVEYRQVGDEDWLPAYALMYEPIREALSGSIVRLEAASDYELKITLLDEGSEVEQQTYTFTTWDDEPPINPDLVYQLEDIYTGGKLDLKALNIKGAEDGWAKIIGSPDTPVIADINDDRAVNIGNQSYIVLENITVKGGRNYGIRSWQAHHIWIKGCNVSEFGRKPNYIIDGIAYEDPNEEAINYDTGISLNQTGVVVIEDCEVHSPNSQANHWGDGHPKGPNALLVQANHPNVEFQGQYVVRNNRFYGSPEKRFNDVIESRSNGRVWGGFVRDSAIHGNYLAYANDDIIELDGGQSNVLFYENEIEQGYCGVSVIPNMLGPSYIFNNYIHNLGDERGKSWAAIKMGGLLSAPAGITNVFDNLIVSNSNGIAVAGFKGDSHYWTNAINNVFIMEVLNNSRGYGIYDLNSYDKSPYEFSQYEDNFIFNLVSGGIKVKGGMTNGVTFLKGLTSEMAERIVNDSNQVIAIESEMVENFSLSNAEGKVIVGKPQLADLSKNNNK